MRDPRECSYFELATVRARRVVNTVYHALNDEQRAQLQDTIERALCDAYESGEAQHQREAHPCQ